MQVIECESQVITLPQTLTICSRYWFGNTLVILSIIGWIITTSSLKTGCAVSQSALTNALGILSLLFPGCGRSLLCGSPLVMGTLKLHPPHSAFHLLKVASIKWTFSLTLRYKRWGLFKQHYPCLTYLSQQAGGQEAHKASAFFPLNDFFPVICGAVSASDSNSTVGLLLLPPPLSDLLGNW
jgi:hypothetical protein